MASAILETKIERQPLKSHKLVSAGYDLDTWTFEIELKNGKVYQYYGVPEYIYKLFEEEDAKARFFDEYIKDAGYSFSQID